MNHPVQLIFSIIILIFISIQSFPQNTIDRNKNISKRAQRVLTGKEQIHQLHDGFLLVKLMTRSASIEALRKYNYNKVADKIEFRQNQYNSRIASAFQEEFSFCPVYFFYSNYSTSVKDKELDEVEILNYDLLQVTSTDFTGKLIMTAEFGNLENDTAFYKDGTYYMPSESKSNRVTRYYSKPNMNISALVIMSDRLVQLRRPFPYYVRTFGFWPFKRRPFKVVRKMNRKLQRYYVRNS